MSSHLRSKQRHSIDLLSLLDTFMWNLGLARYGSDLSKIMQFFFTVFNFKTSRLLFRRNNRIWHKGLACKASNVASNQTSWYKKRILKKGYSVSRDFSWIENYKLFTFNISNLLWGILNRAPTHSHSLPSTPTQSHPLLPTLTYTHPLQLNLIYWHLLPLIFKSLPLIFSPLPPTLTSLISSLHSPTHTHFLRVLRVYCCFSHSGNWELVKSIVGTKFRTSHVCLHPQVRNRLWQLANANGSALLRYAMIKSNTAEFLKIQEHNRKILKRILKRTLK